MKTSQLWPLLLMLGIALCSQVSQTPVPPDAQGEERAIDALIDKTVLFSKNGEFDSALVYAREGIEISEKTGNWNAWGKARLQQIAALYFLGQYAEAVADFPVIEKTAQVHVAADSAFWGEYFNIAGALMNETGNYEEAIRYGLKEIGFYEKKGDQPSLALAGNNLSQYYRGRGDYDRALEYAQSALHIYTTDPGADPADLSWTYGNISAIWYRKKDFAQSAANALAALSILEKHFPGQKPKDHIIIYNDLANAYTELKDYGRALEYLHKALRLAEQHDEESSLITTRHNLGYVYRMTGQYREAVVYLKKAIEGYGASHPNLGKAYRHLGYIALKQGNYRDALTWQQKALRTLADSFPDQDLLANPAPQRVNAYQDFLFTLRDKGETLRRLSEKESSPQFLEASLATYDLAMGLLDSMRAEYQEGSRQFWNQEARPIMESALDAAFRLYRQSADNRYLEQAFRYAENSKALLLAEALRDAAARQRAGIPDSLLQQEKSLKIDIAFYKRQIFKEQQKPAPDTTMMLQWQKTIFERRRAKETLLARLEHSYPEYYHIKYHAPALSIPALQQSLPPGTGLLQYFRGDEGTYVFYFDRSTAQGMPLRADSAFNAAFERLLESLRNRNRAVEQGRNAASTARFAADASTLYRTLVAPVIPQQIPEKLLVIPDGNLSYLPFELLLTEISAASSFKDMPFLLRKTVLRYEYSARLALQPALQRSPRDFFAGYAPAYAGAIPMPARGENTPCGNVESSEFAPLLNNQSEVSQIARLVGGRAFLGAEATEAAFKQHVQAPRVLHLAMHGFLNDCDPLYSGLAFSLPAPGAAPAADKQQEENDGILHAYEIYNLKMNAELSVLSACNTGRGQLAKGEGVISLARAFKYAGCSNVLMSLWQADDQATAQIMQDFYKNLKQGMGKDAAIRQAKLDYLDGANRDHPFFWGAFVLIGDGEPVRQPVAWHWYGVVLLLLAGIGFWYWRAKNKR